MVPDPHAVTPPAMMAIELPQLTPPPRLSRRALIRGGLGSGTPSTEGSALRTALAPGRPGTLGVPHLPARARFPAHVDRVYERA
jgi:hypothetical protein